MNRGGAERLSMRFESWKWKALNFLYVILESDEGASRRSCLLHSSKSHFLSNSFETSHYVSLKEIPRIFDLQTKREEEKYSIL